MTTHVFAETNFLFGVFRMPSKRNPDALALRARFDAGDVKLHVPYLCFQEARNLIAKSLPSNLGSELLEFHRFAASSGAVTWNYDEVKKLLDAATAQVSRTKAVYKQELSDFATALGDGILHGTQEVFDLLEGLDLDADNLKYNDKLILATVLLKAKNLRQVGADQLYFASMDKSDLQPTPERPKMMRNYNDVGLVFVPGFVLPASPA
jgi:hypothetical protein